MSQTLELVFENAKELSKDDRARLVDLLSRPDADGKSGNGGARRKIAAFQDRFAKVLPGTDRFMEEKRREIEYED